MKKYGEDKHYSKKRTYIRGACRFDIINYLIEKNNYVSYLEIGVRDPKACFDRIIAKYKDGVDPNFDYPEIKHIMTSDEFFTLLKDKDVKYDIIFVDGEHLYYQAKIDVLNSLNHLTDNGTIVMHDCSPPTEWHQRGVEKWDGNEAWNGTVWKAYVELRCTRADLNMCVVDTDYGVGVIQRGNQSIWLDRPDKFNYEYLNNNRKELLNLVSVEEFELLQSLK